ncbi:hypothetical protein DOY81_004387 [Sarcophaga bullata]|nr:hypothetical protein DOY81_004387 [Sarcophaga bullata]
MQMEEKFMMSLHKPLVVQGNACCSPDTDKTDVASSVERNSPLSTSLASSESLSTSLRSSELRNLQQLVENPITEVGTTLTNTTTITGSINIVDGQRVPPQPLDLASSANTATNVLKSISEPKELNSSDTTLYQSTTSGKSVSVSSGSNPTTTHMHKPLNLKAQNPTTSSNQQSQSSQQQRR